MQHFNALPDDQKRSLGDKLARMVPPKPAPRYFRFLDDYERGDVVSVRLPDGRVATVPRVVWDAIDDGGRSRGREQLRREIGDALDLIPAP